MWFHKLKMIAAEMIAGAPVGGRHRDRSRLGVAATERPIRRR